MTEDVSWRKKWIYENAQNNKNEEQYSIVAPDSLWHPSKTEWIKTHFWRNPNFLFDLWKYLVYLNPNLRLSFEIQYFWWSYWVNIYWGSEKPKIWLPYFIIRSMKIWRHQNLYVHVIIYVGFYKNLWYLEYTQIQEICQA